MRNKKRKKKKMWLGEYGCMSYLGEKEEGKKKFCYFLFFLNFTEE